MSFCVSSSTHLLFQPDFTYHHPHSLSSYFSQFWKTLHALQISLTKKSKIYKLRSIRAVACMCQEDQIYKWHCKWVKNLRFISEFSGYLIALSLKKINLWTIWYSFPHLVFYHPKNYFHADLNAWVRLNGSKTAFDGN